VRRCPLATTGELFQSSPTFPEVSLHLLRERAVSQRHRPLHPSAKRRQVVGSFNERCLEGGIGRLDVLKHIEENIESTLLPGDDSLPRTIRIVIIMGTSGRFGKPFGGGAA
jgi:hypothetical protein